MNSLTIRVYQEKCRLLEDTRPQFCPCGCGQRYDPQTEEVWVESDRLDTEQLERIREEMGLGDEDDDRDDLDEEDTEADVGHDYIESSMWQQDLMHEEIQEFRYAEEDEEDREYDYYEDGIFEDDLHGRIVIDLDQGGSPGGWESANISPGWGAMARSDIDEAEPEVVGDAALEDEADDGDDDQSTESEASDSDSNDLSDEDSDGEKY